MINNRLLHSTILKQFLSPRRPSLSSYPRTLNSIICIHQALLSPQSPLEWKRRVCKLCLPLNNSNISKKWQCSRLPLKACFTICRPLLREAVLKGLLQHPIEGIISKKTLLTLVKRTGLSLGSKMMKGCGNRWPHLWNFQSLCVAPIINLNLNIDDNH